MQPIYLKRLIKSNLPVRVKTHSRGGKLVRQYVRSGKDKKDVIKKSSTALKASQAEMKEIIKDVNKNVAYLVYMGKIIASSHGLPVQFIDSRPQGDLADLISEGKHGMILGGMEWLRKDLRVDQLTQMKTRAKQKMRNAALKLRNTVVLPVDVTKDLNIIAIARNKLLQEKSGGRVSAEEIAKIVTLKRRTRGKGAVEYEGVEKLNRIEALLVYAESKPEINIDEHQFISESDVKMWTEQSSEQSDRRLLINKIIDNLVSEKKMSVKHREILYLKFYFDKPGDGYKTRSYENIAKIFEKNIGGKIRGKVGDKHDFTPVGAKYQITGIITTIKPKYFMVQGKGEKREYTIIGKPPLIGIKGAGKMDIWRLYKEAIEILVKQPELKNIWDVMKSMWNKVSKSLAIFTLQPRTP